MLVAGLIVALASVCALGCSKSKNDLNGPPTPDQKKAFAGGPMPDYARKQMAEDFARRAAAQHAGGQAPASHP
jgi:hypothetical protein